MKTDPYPYLLWYHNGLALEQSIARALDRYAATFGRPANVILASYDAEDETRRAAPGVRVKGIKSCQKDHIFVGYDPAVTELT
jgi:hypothetical protein